MKKKFNNSGITGLETLLVICFIVLKLLHVINWSWLIILCPIWILLGVVLGCNVEIAIKKYKHPYAMRRKEFKVFNKVARNWGLDIDGDTISVRLASSLENYKYKKIILRAAKRVDRTGNADSFYINLRTKHIQ